MDNRRYFVICADHCLFEAMSKEQILSAIMQAVNDGTIGDIDAGIVSKIVEQNKKRDLSFWVGTESEFNALGIDAKSVLCRIGVDGNVYICNDDSVVGKADEDIPATVKATKTNGEEATNMGGIYFKKVPNYDPAEFPFALAGKGTLSGEDMYYFIASSGEIVKNTDGTKYLYAKEALKRKVYFDSDGFSDGVYLGPYEADVEAGMPIIETEIDPVWSNFDIHGTGDVLYLAASEPETAYRSTVTVDATYDDGSVSSSVIDVGYNGYPERVTKDGKTCELTWEGF